MSELHRELRRPQIQRGVLALVRNSPSESIRARLSRAEIEHRALTAIPEDLLKDVPKEDHAYSLFEGFQASLPEDDGETEHRKRHRRHRSRNEPKMLEDGKEEEGGPPALAKLQRGRDRVAHRLEMMGVRKNMCSAEILEIDKKIANLGKVRGIVLERLSDLEEDEVKVEAELLEMDHKVEEMQELLEQEAEVANLEPMTPATTESASIADGEDEDGVATPTGSPTFMSQSIYEKLPSPKSAKRHRPPRRRSAAVRHGHFEPGTRLRVLPAHTDMVTALDFDAPFGTMVTAALDDTVRVWDLNRGRCLGLLEGHRASVRCLQVEDNLVATGSIDASVRLWDLSQAEYPTPAASNSIHHSADPEDDGLDSPSNPDDTFSTAPPPSSMADTPVFNLSAHVAEVTALHFHKDTLVSGSADKTLRQWDLVKGRCVQTLDVLWAAAQASTPVSSTSTRSSTGGRSAPNGGVATAGWSSTSMARLSDPEADFVGALQCFDAALACGTADGMVRLWDLRSGQVHRSLVGHTAPVSALQFDDVRLVTGSLDRSIRVRVSFQRLACLCITSVVSRSKTNHDARSADLGSPDRRHLRRLRLRSAGHGHDVRRAAYCRGCGRASRQDLRQVRRPPLGLWYGR